ncbi:MAG TPA: VOC family protein [Acidimicrobiales bacterium]|nr:VOC family protein [Acidimicrobiales bacterium]
MQTEIVPEEGDRATGRATDGQLRSDLPGTKTQKIAPVGFDHIVLSVNDVERSLAFYCGTLGLEPVKVDEWRANRVRFPSARVNAETIIDLVHGEHSGMNLDHFCLVIEPMDFDELISSGNLEIERGPAMRSGAQGTGLSIYLRDPDHNLVELRYYA